MGAVAEVLLMLVITALLGVLFVMLLVYAFSQVSCTGADLTPPDTGSDPSSCVFDFDEDGFCSSDDCNDWNRDIHPGAQEICDGLRRDEDCDGVSDNDDPSATGQTLEMFHDEDEDGYGDPDRPIMLCREDTGRYTYDDSDVDDSDPRIWREEGSYTGDIDGAYADACHGARALHLDGALILSGVRDGGLARLSCIVSVTGGLHVLDSPQLTTLDGLTLTTVEGGFRIDSAGLSDLRALSGAAISGPIELRSAPDLSSLDGLSPVAIDGLIVVDTGLQDLSPLSGAAISGLVELRKNPALADLSALADLQAVDSLSIGSCDALTDLSGLASLAAISGPLTIQRNDALQSLQGMAALTTVDGDIVVTDNAALCADDEAWLLGQLQGYAGISTWRDNAGACP